MSGANNVGGETTVEIVLNDAGRAELDAIAADAKKLRERVDKFASADGFGQFVDLVANP